MSTVEQLAAIDRLRARPLPAARGGPSRGAEGGPGFHLADLRVSEEFWEDDGSRIREAEEQFEAECEALVVLLSRRWGEPRVLDLTEHLIRSAEGEAVPEPLATLCGCVGVLYAWRAGGRWLAVGLGRQGRELPLRLLAVVAEEDPEDPDGEDRDGRGSPETRG
ncbi:hypothetical protein [Streptomyces sp. MNU89]|uniref:hypothetical protein n=1 Tax=Streptomyces sp. MNU89 TaxID=2560025 RepID=UPI001E53CA93|nr:hypothetical protein [Streptomyces sp. MNU89]MCC9737802.1 hypothetical protein [Streptomyces sp. MNU89]